jgi:S-layer protein (TIGR01567 family)
MEEMILKQMKAIAMVALVLLALAGAAAAAETVDVRSTVMTFSEGGVTPATIDPTSWAGLYYDFDKGQGTETFTIDVAGSNKINITYETTPIPVEAEEGSFGNFNLIGFFAEEYVALSGDDSNKVFANKVAKLIIDEDEKYTLKTGQSLDLGAGYTVIPKQIDVDGNKVWIELQYNGETIDDAIINTNRTNDADKNWVLKQDVLDEDNVIVFQVHVNEVFQGSVDSLVEIEGVWLCDFENAVEIKDDTDYNKFECEAADESGLKYVAKNVTLAKDKDSHLGKGIYIVTGDKYNDNKQFMFVKRYTEAGTYEVRSSVLPTKTGEQKIDYTQFAAFYYDLDEDIATENMTITITEDNKLKNDSGIVYTTTARMISFEESNISGQYPIVGLFGAAYVPLMDKDKVIAEKLTKLIIDDDEKYTLKTGQSLDLGAGYVVIPKQIDVDGNKVWIELQKDGETVDDAIINTNSSNNDQKTWTLKQDVLDEDDIVVLNVHVNEVFQGSVDSLVEIQGVWLIDYVNAFEIKEDDSFGKLDFDGTEDNTLVFVSNTNITLAKDKDIKLGGVDNCMMKIKTNSPDSGADNLFYLYVEKTLGESAPVNPTTPEEPTEEPTSAPAQPTTQPAQPTTEPAQPTTSAPATSEPAPQPEEKKSNTMMYIIIAVVIIILIVAAVAILKKSGKI